MKFPFPRLWANACAVLLRAFNNEGVEYLLIGSMAKAFHCPEMACVNDMDLMIDPTPENAGKVLSALRAVPGAGDLKKLVLNIERLTKEGVQLHVLCGQGDVDVLTPPPKEKGFIYHEAAGRSTEELIPHFGIPVQVASMCDLETLDSLREQSTKPPVPV